jgi:hypothetical protein
MADTGDSGISGTAKFVVYEYGVSDTGEPTDEAWGTCWHRVEERAIECATKQHRKSGVPYRIDVDIWEGDDIVDASPDMWGIGFAGLNKGSDRPWCVNSKGNRVKGEWSPSGEWIVTEVQEGDLDT